MPELPQSTLAASKSKSLLKIAVFNARAHPIDPGSFQDQTIIKKYQCSLPELPQSIQAASKIKSLPSSMPELPSRPRQLPRSNPYLRISVSSARAPPLDPGSFQDQVLMKNSPFQCQSSPRRSRQLPRSNPYFEK